MSSAEQPYGPLVDTTVRVMTWNVWGRFGPWREREAGLLHVLGSVDADIVLLQESWIADDGTDQAARWAERLGLQHCSAGSELLYGDWGPAVAILSRWPIRLHTPHTLPFPGPAGWGGVALQAAVEGPRGAISVYSVALDWPPQGGPARAHALRHLAGVVEGETERSRVLVVGGDLNAGPGSDEIRMLTGKAGPARPGFVLFDAWEVTHPPDAGGATWSNANPWAAPMLLADQRIDHLFTGWPRRGGVGSAVSTSLAGTETVEGVVPSDHYAVVADIRY